MSSAIDRESLVPYYHQLKQHLLAEIKRQKLQPGDRLPGDHELCQIHDVSRTVVRQALSELEAEGVIKRSKGRGTFVAPPKTDKGMLGSLTGLVEDVASRGGGVVRSQVFRQEVEPASSEVAAKLGLVAGAPVIVIDRLRFLDDEPVVFTTTYIAEALAPDLVHDDLREDSLYRLLRAKYRANPVRAVRSIEAVLAQGVLAKRLGVDPGSPLLVLRNVSFDERDAPLEMFVSYHRGDVTRFDVNLRQGSQMRASAPAP